MIVDHERRFVFYHIPKTGGSSMAIALAGRDPGSRERGWQKALHSSGFMHDNTPAPEGYFTFAFFRNPYDRMVSLYQALAPPILFPRFVESCLVRRTISHIALRPQTNMIDPRTLSFEGNYEDIEADWNYLNDKLDLGVPYEKLPRENQSGVYKDYESFYDSEAVNLVRRVYQQDFRLLGYDPDAHALL